MSAGHVPKVHIYAYSNNFQRRWGNHFGSPSGCYK